MEWKYRPAGSFDVPGPEIYEKGKFMIREIRLGGIGCLETIEGTDEWYCGSDYVHGDLYEAEELYQDGHEIDANRLYQEGTDVPLSLEDFQSYAAYCVTDTAGACRLLNCSRQNISDLVRRGKLHPIRSSSAGALFLMTELRQRLWQ